MGGDTRLLHQAHRQPEVADPPAALVGAVLGARVGLTLPDLVILRVFLGLLVVIAARYLWDLVGLF